MAARKGNCGYASRRQLTPLERFRSYCRFEADTGCVVWTGARTSGRGHHIPYGAFWYSGRRWFSHRWAAKFIHGFDIDGWHVDHCCHHTLRPNTLCVQHLQTKTLLENVELQHMRRKHFVHLQVGMLDYAEVYGADPCDALTDGTTVPFYTPPTWLGTTEGTAHATCPF